MGNILDMFVSEINAGGVRGIGVCIGTPEEVAMVKKVLGNIGREREDEFKRELEELKRETEKKRRECRKMVLESLNTLPKVVYKSFCDILRGHGEKFCEKEEIADLIMGNKEYQDLYIATLKTASVLGMAGLF